MEKKLYRDEQHKKIAGVCAGLAEYLNVDVTVIRVIFLLALVLKGVGLVPYIILWIVLPKKLNFTAPFNAPHVDYTVPPQPYNPFSNMPPVQPGAPFVPPAKKRSSAALIVGIALVIFGSFFLLDEFNILPDLDMERLWPIVFIILGVVVIFNGKKDKPWEKEDWHTTEKKPEEFNTVDTEDKITDTEDKPADNTPGI